MEVDDEYSDEDYGELFKTYILNVTNDDLANLTSPGSFNNSDDNAYSDESQEFVTLLFALNIVSGIGILVNSVLAFMIIVDFIIDKSMRFWTRHWLLLNSSITHVAYLGISIYIREFGRHKDQIDRNCLVLQHTDKTIEFVTSLYLVIIAINVAGNIVKPSIPCGKKSILFWIFFILFIMVCANVGVLALFTMELDGLPRHLKCQVDVTFYLPARNVHLVSIVTFYIPFGLLLTLAFSSLICSCTPQRHLSLTESENNEYYTARKHAAIFIFITATAGFLLKLPYYLFQVPVLAYFVLAGLNASFYATFFITNLMKLLFYVLFPILCLCLKDIRVIYRKAVSN